MRLLIRTLYWWLNFTGTLAAVIWIAISDPLVESWWGLAGSTIQGVITLTLVSVVLFFLLLALEGTVQFARLLCCHLSRGYLNECGMRLRCRIRAAWRYEVDSLKYWLLGWVSVP